MNEWENHEPEDEETEGEDGEDQAADPESLIDLLTGELVSASAKNKLIQSVLRQLIETYGFDRTDLKAGYRLTTAGKRQKTVTIAILRRRTTPVDETIEQIVV
jgi:type I restriction enzyme M protein